ncbi:MAG TPA: SCP2 sterol-binding domain-containing protein [Steroidobacteraceae bacterium]|jgi:ubiquinone biosynthesis protein UbiJ|nr:SCP2 sterol-binding domain-containing protein [Steroidobacteraceae bacterium]
MKPVELLIEQVLSRVSARVRRDSPRGCDILAELKDRSLAISISGTPWGQHPIVIESTGEALRLRPAPDFAADATLSAAPLSLLALARDEPEAVIRRGDVRVEGDARIAQRFRELLPLLAPDLEQELSRLLGRSAAHLVAGAWRGAADTVRRTAWTSVQNVAEYLAHESGDLVSRHEAEHFLRGVEQAREQLDRIEARLARLERHFSGLGGGPGPP